jgi:AGCS family alanine or glycine:cation symporter
MIDTILDVAASIDRLLWGPWTLVLIASVSLYFTARSRVFQVRGLAEIFRTTFGSLLRGSTAAPDLAAGAEGLRDGSISRDDTRPLPGPGLSEEKKGRMTPFQATSTALASTVGMGSIAGIAVALSIGGPGAIFWMWLLALISTITKTAEITLAVHYRDIDETGRIRGGPMYYIRRGLGWPALATVFSVAIIVNSLFSASLLQAHTVGRSFLASYGLNPYLVAGSMTLVTAIVVIGGVRRIGRVSEALVPFMSLVYVGGGLMLFLVNWREVPQVFASVFQHALSPIPAAGGFAGAAVMQAIQEGVSRGMFSNEAGMGTAPMAHATAETEHPFQQGMWGAFEVFVVTFVICTITCFAVLSTGVLSSGESGIELVIMAFSTVFPEAVAGNLISFCILSFCLSTQIGFFIYFETALVDVVGRAATRWIRFLYFIPPLVFAGVADVDRLWVFANIAVAICAIPNLVAVLSLGGVFMTLMDDYRSGTRRYATRIIDSSKDYVRSSGRA